MPTAMTTRRHSDLRQGAGARRLSLHPAVVRCSTLVFVLAPVVVTFVLSFTYYDPMMGSRWVGFDNFQRFFTDDRSLQIFWNTLRFTLFAVTGNVSRRPAARAGAQPRDARRSCSISSGSPISCR